MIQEYPSNITRSQFAKIKPILQKANKTTKPRKADLYEIFCALLYVMKTGCQWRMLPHDFPKWQIVYYYFSVWKIRKDGTSVLEEVLKKIGCWRAYEKWQKALNEHGYCC